MTPQDETIRTVAEGEWEIVAWLWQAYRNDLAQVVAASLPYPDGRYKHVKLDAHPGDPDHGGFLAWVPHPQDGRPAPAGFALVRGITGPRRTISDFWVAPGARRGGLGGRLARHAIATYDGAWEIAFQHDNLGAGRFWRSVATGAWGSGWTETEEPVPGRADVPPDHWIRSV